MPVASYWDQRVCEHVSSLSSKEDKLLDQLWVTIATSSAVEDSNTACGLTGLWPHQGVFRPSILTSIIIVCLQGYSIVCWAVSVWEEIWVRQTQTNYCIPWSVYRAVNRAHITNEGLQEYTRKPLQTTGLVHISVILEWLRMVFICIFISLVVHVTAKIMSCSCSAFECRFQRYQGWQNCQKKDPPCLPAHCWYTGKAR